MSKYATGIKVNEKALNFMESFNNIEDDIMEPRKRQKTKKKT